MRRLAAATAAVLLVLGGALPAAAAPAAARAYPMPRQSWLESAGEYQPQVTTHRVVVGESVQGRPIVARHYGAADAPVQLVVLGQMHGSEPGGRQVAELLAGRAVPEGVGLWVVTSMNPDGHRRGSRVNARGVDLNRNFPQDWRRQGRGSIFWSGPRAASEPETRGMVRFLEAVQPDAVLSFHQAYDVVDITHPRSRPAGRQLARWMGEEARVVPCGGPCRGTLTQWVDRELGAIAITVELDDRVSRAEARRAAEAVLRLGSWLGR